jgi:hypothetical protein
MLVSAAQALMTLVADQELRDYSKMTITQFKVKEMEQQTLILRLEKELERSRKELFRMRKEHYGGSKTPVAAAPQAVETPPAQPKAATKVPQSGGRKLPTPQPAQQPAAQPTGVSEEALSAEEKRLQRFINK